MYKIQLKQLAQLDKYEFSKNSYPILRNFYKKSTINKKKLIGVVILFFTF